MWFHWRWWADNDWISPLNQFFALVFPKRFHGFSSWCLHFFQCKQVEMYRENINNSSNVARSRGSEQPTACYRFQFNTKSMCFQPSFGNRRHVQDNSNVFSTFNGVWLKFKLPPLVVFWPNDVRREIILPLTQIPWHDLDMMSKDGTHFPVSLQRNYRIVLITAGSNREKGLQDYEQDAHHIVALNFELLWKLIWKIKQCKQKLTALDCFYCLCWRLLTVVSTNAVEGRKERVGN